MNVEPEEVAHLTGVQDGTGAAVFGPGQRIDADGAQGEPSLARAKDLTDFDLHLGVGSFVVSGQHAGLDDWGPTHTHTHIHTHGLRGLKSAWTGRRTQPLPTVIMLGLTELGRAPELLLLAATLPCAQTSGLRTWVTRALGGGGWGGGVATTLTRVTQGGDGAALRPRRVAFERAVRVGNLPTDGDVEDLVVRVAGKAVDWRETS